MTRFDYQDEDGIWWIMCACGHRAGYSGCWDKPKPTHNLCPNCMLLVRFRTVPIKYKRRLVDRISNDAKLG